MVRVDRNERVLRCRIVLSWKSWRDDLFLFFLFFFPEVVGVTRKKKLLIWVIQTGVHWWAMRILT